MSTTEAAPTLPGCAFVSATEALAYMDGISDQHLGSWAGEC
jgi:hypothetical protein